MTSDDSKLPAKIEPAATPAKYTKKDAAQDAAIAGSSVAKAALSLIPGVGGVVVEIWNGGQELQRRRQEKALQLLVDQHGIDLDELKAKLNSDEDLADIVMRGLDAARKASFSEKLDVLAAVMAGSAEEDSADRVFARVLFQVLEVVEREHIEVMLIIRDWPEVDPTLADDEEVKKNVANAQNIGDKAPHLKPVLGVIINSLESIRLIVDEAAGTWFGASGNKRYKIDELGIHLLAYLERAR